MFLPVSRRLDGDTSPNWEKKKGNYQTDDRREGLILLPFSSPFNLRGVKIMPVGDYLIGMRWPQIAYKSFWCDITLYYSILDSCYYSKQC